jgi:hypothetical protein
MAQAVSGHHMCGEIEGSRLAARELRQLLLIRKITLILCLIFHEFEYQVYFLNNK